MASGPGHTRVFSAPRERVAADHSRPLRLMTLAATGLVALTAATSLLGWIVDEPNLERLVPGLATMKFDTALTLLLLAVAYALPRRTLPVRRIAVGCAVLAGATAAAQLLEYATDADLGIDQLLVTDHGGGQHPGRASMAGAICVLVLACACLLTGPSAAPRRLRQALALCTAALSGMALLGFCFSVDSLYALGPFSSLALTTALALALLSVAALTSTERGAIEWSMFGTDAGATLLRRQGLVALVGLPLIGLACVGLRRLGWLDAVSTITLTVLLCMMTSLLATWLSAQRVARIDQARLATLHDLSDLKKTLELQVTARADQLRSRSEEIAVLEDRQRIAADIHDIVIQRLFAAGMFLHGMPAKDPAVQQRIDTAIESLDSAIKELRTSIFALGGHRGQALDLASAIDDVCTESARVLGFRPEITVDDPDDEADTVRDDLLAVLRESLSNVAKHAQASSVAVVLRTGSGLISLTVTDDGTGMTRSPHSSGTRNMAERARRFGGDCVWTTVAPHGTRVWWHVPGNPPDFDVPRPAATDAQRPGDVPAPQ